MMSQNLISHVCEPGKFVMAILHWKQVSLCDKIKCHHRTKLTLHANDRLFILFAANARSRTMQEAE